MPDWILPSVIGAFAVVLWWLARRVIAKQEELDKGVHAKLDALQAYMVTEIRQFDVRLSVVETLVLPNRNK